VDYSAENAFEIDEMTCGTAGVESLGKALGPEQTAAYLTVGSNKIWRREYENGWVYVRAPVNSGASASVADTATVNVSLGATLYAPRGVKETTVNNHAPRTIWSSTRDRDAIILMKNPT
jgi:hypothetical protein